MNHLFPKTSYRYSITHNTTSHIVRSLLEVELSCYKTSFVILWDTLKSVELIIGGPDCTVEIFDFVNIFGFGQWSCKVVPMSNYGIISEWRDANLTVYIKDSTLKNLNFRYLFPESLCIWKDNNLGDWALL